MLNRANRLCEEKVPYTSQKFLRKFLWRRGVAQLVARLVRDQEVVGSNPVTPTNKKE